MAVRTNGWSIQDRVHSRQLRLDAVEAYRGGVSARAVAKEYGVSHQTVLNWARRAGVGISPKGRRV